MLVFLTGSRVAGAEQSDYFLSKNCVREFRRAVETGKPMIIVEETDEIHGHVSLDVHKAACPAELQSAFDESAIVPWYRAKTFQHVSLRMILARLLKRAGTCNGSLNSMNDILIDDRLTRREVTLPLLPEGRFHLYVSPFNDGAPSVADLLVAEANKNARTKVNPSNRSSIAGGQALAAAPLSVCQVPEERHRASAFMLYLNKATHASGEASASLHNELEAALAERMPLLLVHERRAGYGAVEFAYFFSMRDGTTPVTPPQLFESSGASKEDGPAHPGIYDSLAVPLYGGEHQAMSLRLVLASSTLCSSAFSDDYQPKRGRLATFAATFVETLRVSSLRRRKVGVMTQHEKPALESGSKPSVKEQQLEPSMKYAKVSRL